MGVKGALTADENLRFYHPEATIEARWQALAQVELVGFEDVPVAQLSAGQQRRVALARLWLSRATFWILDEPFTALDAAGVQTLTTRLEQHVGGRCGHPDHPSTLAPALRSFTHDYAE